MNINMSEEDNSQKNGYVIIVITREKRMYQSIREYLSFELVIKLIYDVLAFMFYALELGFFIYSSNENIKNFENKPEYETLTYQNAMGTYSRTVVAKGSSKFCGYYGDPESVVQFANNISDIYFALAYVYLVVYSIQAIIDWVKRLRTRIRSRFQKYREEPLSPPSTFEICMNTLGFVICPLIKFILIGMIYPVLCVKFNDCIETQHNYEFLIQSSFFNYMNLGFLATVALVIVIVLCLAITVMITIIHAIFLCGFLVFCCPCICCNWINDKQNRSFGHHLNDLAFGMYCLWFLFVIAYSITCVVVMSCAFTLTQFPYSISFILRWVMFQFFEKTNIRLPQVSKNLI